MSAATKPTDLGALVERVNALEDWRDDVNPRLREVERVVPSEEDQKDIEHRIRALEAVRWKNAGAIGIIVFVCTVVGTFLAKKMGG